PLHFDGVSNGLPFAAESSSSAAKHLVKLGLNYKFREGATPAAMPVYPATYKALPAAIYDWTGCYIGVHAGGGGLYDHYTNHQGSGGLAGAQLGCNYQSGRVVVGVEAEGWWSGLRSIEEEIGAASRSTLTATNRWDADVAIRAGFAIDRALIYSKVG